MLETPFYSKIKTNIEQRHSHLCVGLDPQIEKIPPQFSKDLNGLEAFLNAIIDCTKDLCIAYKPNISFFEAHGIDGLRLLESICKVIPAETPIILDAKRGDIGNTSKMQAKYIFDYFGADATTLHPYMGDDSVGPFLDYTDKFSFILALTSNPGAQTFEKQPTASGQPLYLSVAKQAEKWAEKTGNIGLVVGATQDEMRKLRSTITQLPFLIPGVGAQGGSYKDAVAQGKNPDNVALVNVSRGILYASQEPTFQEDIRTLIRQNYCGD